VSPGAANNFAANKVQEKRSKSFFMLYCWKRLVFKKECAANYLTDFVFEKNRLA
jgi:hypothetical protein